MACLRHRNETVIIGVKLDNEFSILSHLVPKPRSRVIPTGSFVGFTEVGVARRDENNPEYSRLFDEAHGRLSPRGVPDHDGPLVGFQDVTNERQPNRLPCDIGVWHVLYADLDASCCEAIGQPPVPIAAAGVVASIACSNGDFSA